MNSTTTRRRFLEWGLGTAGALALPPFSRAVEPFVRSGPPRLRLSLAAYSFRDQLQPPHGGTPSMDLFQFIDFCAEHGCDGAELTSYYFPPEVSDDFLLKVRRHAHLRGVTVSGTAVGNDFCHPAGAKRDAEQKSVHDWIRKAAVLGAPHIRVFAGAAHGQPEATARALCVEALEQAADVAGRYGIFLGVENHGGIVSEAGQLVELVQAVKSPWVGVNLDTGNFHTADPYADLARCAPYAVNVQFKGQIQARGQKEAHDADVPRVFGILREARYQGWVALEYEMAPDPLKQVPVLLRQMRDQMG
jgi:sugar phosphate isomerase/epimerase